MYTITTPYTADFQLIASWLISFDKYFDVRVLKNGNIEISVLSLNQTQIKCLETADITFVIRDYESRDLILNVISSYCVDPAHVCK